MSAHVDELEALLKEAGPSARIIMYEDAMWLLGLVREAVLMALYLSGQVPDGEDEDWEPDGRMGEGWLARLEKGPQP